MIFYRQYFLAICKEPYRLFFPLGMVIAVGGVGHWALYGFGLSPSYSSQFHSLVMTLGYMPCFITGFLLTAMPRFSGTISARPGELFYFLLTIVGVVFFLFRQEWILAEAFYLGWLLGLIRFALTRLKLRAQQKSSPSSAPKEMIWIPIAVLHGLIGTILFILVQLKLCPSSFIHMSKPLLEQGFLLSIVIGIGGFLIPRLMGTDAKRECVISFHLCAGVLLFLSFCLEGFQLETMAYALRAFIVGMVFTRAGIFPRPPQTKDFYVKLVWISAWMILCGFGLVALFPIYRAVFLHIVFIGGWSLMTFAVGTMVVMTHSGEIERLRKQCKVLWLIAFIILLALLKRIGVIFFPDDYFRFLSFAAVLWITAAFIWIMFIFRPLIKFPETDKFQEMHEEAKRRRIEK